MSASVLSHSQTSSGLPGQLDQSKRTAGFGSSSRARLCRCLFPPRPGAQIDSPRSRSSDRSREFAGAATLSAADPTDRVGTAS